MGWIRVLCVSYFWFVASILCTAQPAQEKNIFLLSDHASFFVDTAELISPENLSEAVQGRFLRDDIQISADYPTWVKIDIPADISAGDYCLMIHMHETVYLYSKEGGQFKVKKNGRYLPPAQRSVPEDHRYICFSFQDNARTIYLKINPVYGYEGSPEITMEPKDTVASRINATTRMSFFMGGAILLIVLTSLTLYTFLDDSTYLTFAVYVICSYTMSNLDFLSYIFGDAYQLLLLDGEVLQTYYIICPLSLLWFTHTFFQMRTQSLNSHRIFVAMMLASIVCFVTIPVDGGLNSDLILYYNILTVLLVAVYSAIAYFKLKFGPAGFFLIAFIVPILVAALIVLNYTGILQVPGLNLLAGLAFLFQSCILSIGLLKRYQKVNEALLQSTFTQMEKEHEARIFKIRNTELLSRNEVIENQKVRLQQQARELEEMNLTKDKLLTVLAHDLRAPVNNLKGILTLLSSRLLTTDEFHGLSEKLKTDVESVNEMLEDVLHWVKSQHGGIVPRPVDFDLKESADEVIRLATPAAKDKNVELVIESVRHPVAHADPDHVQIIVRNLISNAIKFARQRTSVQLKIEPLNRFMRITITDYGVGMAREAVDHIISGKKVSSTPGTKGEKGTGLGLLLCREFIDLNGGEFFLRSVVGEGTSVSFTLPRPEARQSPK